MIGRQGSGRSRWAAGRRWALQRLAGGLPNWKAGRKSGVDPAAVTGGLKLAPTARATVEELCNSFVTENVEKSRNLRAQPRLTAYSLSASTWCWGSRSRRALQSPMRLLSLLAFEMSHLQRRESCGGSYAESGGMRWKQGA